MFDDLDDLYQEVIREHSSHPRNFHELPPPAKAVAGHNPLCGDEIHLYVAMEGDRVKDVGFTGQGCAISKASASMLTDAIRGKSRDEVKRAFEAFHEMVTAGRCCCLWLRGQPAGPNDLRCDGLRLPCAGVTVSYLTTL